MRVTADTTIGYNHILPWVQARARYGPLNENLPISFLHEWVDNLSYRKGAALGGSGRQSIPLGVQIVSRSPKKRSAGPALLFTVALVALGLGAYIKTRTGVTTQPASGNTRATADSVAVAPVRQDTAPVVPVEAAALPWLSDAATAPPDPARAAQLLQAGRDAATQGDPLAARTKLAEALLSGPEPREVPPAREELLKLCEETVFSTTVTKNDPLIDTYVIQPGDTLEKIAKAYFITDDLLTRINGIKNKNQIRLGQRIKVIRGPFHAVVTKSTFDLDVYLQNTFVKHFKVGLGTDSSTPAGEWVCENKLVNPTYFPPRGGAIKAADNPENPLGERWIGLKGLTGEAVGQERYGIHGTIDPDSIGKAVSMGCIRLRNEDVGLLYEMLVAEKSHVVVRE